MFAVSYVQLTLLGRNECGEHSLTRIHGSIEPVAFIPVEITLALTYIYTSSCYKL